MADLRAALKDEKSVAVMGLKSAGSKALIGADWTAALKVSSLGTRTAVGLAIMSVARSVCL